MPRVTRRTFFHYASAGAAALGAFATVSRLSGSPAPGAIAGGAVTDSTRAAGAEAASLPSAGPLVAYVRDAARGELALFVGDREVSVRDPELVDRLLRASA